MLAWRLWLWSLGFWSPSVCGGDARCSSQDEDQHCLLQSGNSILEPEWDIQTLQPTSSSGWQRQSMDLAGQIQAHGTGNLIRNLGCWPMDPEDDLPRADARFHDRTCVDFKGAGRCRSGFPFFRFHMPEGMESRECPRFCLSKGLDMAGIIDTDKKGFECRCGASPANAAAWQRKFPRKKLLLDFKAKVAMDDPRCQISVYRYSGAFENGGVPLDHIGISLTDRDYMVDVAVGRSVNNEAEDSDEVEKTKVKVVAGGPDESGEIGHLLTQSERKSIEQKSRTTDGNRSRAAASLLQSNRSELSRMMCADDPVPKFKVGGRMYGCKDVMLLCRRPDALGSQVTISCPFTCGLCTDRDAWTPCFPDACGSGKPWLTQDQSGNFLIPYVFDENVDHVRRDAFAAATQAWEESTCIQFKQGGNRPRIRVVLEDFSSCYAEIGYPGPNGETRVNLGSCNSQRSVGNIIHELGHVLGMAHHHRRPDAGSKIWLADEKRHVGPYLIFHWENIPPNVRVQYEPDVNAYMGSNYQGAGDQRSGYSPYDYGSIMHYSQGNNRIESAQKAVYNNDMGQRNYPSQSDFRQIRDMYQCGGKTRHISRSSYETTSLWYWLGYDVSDIARWSTGIFGSCLRLAGTDECYRTRPVHCLGMHGEPVDNEHACRPQNRPKARESCPCGFACEDKYPTGITQRGVQFSCWQLAKVCYGEAHSQAVRDACPVTCDLCGTPNQTTSAETCKDLSPTSLIRVSGKDKEATCQELAAQGVCHSRLATTVQLRCPESCGVCPPAAAEACVDDDKFKDAGGYGCLAYIGYDCPGEVLEACPQSCGLCK